jgi:hypothetical protein
MHHKVSFKNYILLEFIFFENYITSKGNISVTHICLYVITKGEGKTGRDKL